MKSLIIRRSDAVCRSPRRRCAVGAVTVEVSGRGEREVGVVVGGVIVHHNHHHADSGIVECLDHFLHLAYAG